VRRQCVGGRERRSEAFGVSLGRTAFSADLGGSINYSNENFEGKVEKVSVRTAIGHG